MFYCLSFTFVVVLLFEIIVSYIFVCHLFCTPNAKIHNANVSSFIVVVVFVCVSFRGSSLLSPTRFTCHFTETCLQCRRNYISCSFWCEMLISIPFFYCCCSFLVFRNVACVFHSSFGIVSLYMKYLSLSEPLYYRTNFWSIVDLDFSQGS